MKTTIEITRRYHGEVSSAPYWVKQLVPLYRRILMHPTLITLVITVGICFQVETHDVITTVLTWPSIALLVATAINANTYWLQQRLIEMESKNVPEPIHGGYLG